MKFNIIGISEGGRDKTPPGGRALGLVWPGRESWFSSTWASDWNTLLTWLLPSGIEAMKGWAPGAPQAQGTLGLAHCGGRGSSSQNCGAHVSRELEGSHGLADTGRDPCSSPALPGQLQPPHDRGLGKHWTSGDLCWTTVLPDHEGTTVEVSGGKPGQPLTSLQLEVRVWPFWTESLRLSDN